MTTVQGVHGGGSDSPYNYDEENDENMVLIMGCGTLFVVAIVLGVIFVWLWRIFE